MTRKYKWEIFVDKVLAGMTQREAYKTTFSCEKMTDEQIDSEASALLNGTGRYAKNPKASQRYKKLNEKAQQEADEKAIADATEVLEYLTRVMRGESRAEIVVVEGTGEGCSNARRMLKAPDEKERLDAAKQLGKRYGLFNDKAQIEIVVPVFGGEEEFDAEES